MPSQVAPLRVSSNGRYLVTDAGVPFFWLADTAWRLFERLTDAEIDRYLDDRVAKRFSVIQSCLMMGGRHEGFAGGRPDRLDSAFFARVDSVLDRAAARGLRMALIPAWGHYHVREAADARPTLDTEAAEAFGLALGDRYRSRPQIVWLLGGDTVPTERTVAVYRALAGGLRKAGCRQLISFHPRGDGRSSSDWFHGDEWLDFNAIQTGPRFGLPNYLSIWRDWQRFPAKPTLDSEPGYENATPHRLSAYDVRRYAYWAVMAGACGHTYGALEVWQFHTGESGRRSNLAERHWREALGYPGAAQMRHLRRLVESRPMLTRMPWIEGVLVRHEHAGAPHWNVGTGDRIVASGDRVRSYVMVYSPRGAPVAMRFRDSHTPRRAHWFDPRTGAVSRAHVAQAATATFTPPTSGRTEDWVLVVEDERRKYPLPGDRFQQPADD